MKKKNGGMGLMVGEYKPPSMHEQVKMSAEHMGRMVAEAHPKVKKIQDEISRSVQAAAMKHLGSGKAKKSAIG